MGKEVEEERSEETESCASSGLILGSGLGLWRASSLQMRGLREWRLRGKKRAAVGGRA